MSSPPVPISYAAYPWKHILVSHHPPTSPIATQVIIITINRPEKANAYTTGIQNEMISAFDFLDSDDRVKAIVVTGKGKMFCAGADLDIGLFREEGGKSKGHRDGSVLSIASSSSYCRGNCCTDCIAPLTS
jgi:enoyl-CoA hydratase/carnithine racemase